MNQYTLVHYTSANTVKFVIYLETYELNKTRTDIIVYSMVHEFF
jgi:hypothetical protein